MKKTMTIGYPETITTKADLAPGIDLRGIAANQAVHVANVKRQLRVYFNNDLDAMRRYYGWKIDAPILAIIAS